MDSQTLTQSLLSTPNHSPEQLDMIKAFLLDPTCETILTTTVSSMYVPSRGIYLFPNDSRTQDPSMHGAYHLRWGGLQSGTKTKNGLVKRTCKKATCNKREITVKVVRYDIDSPLAQQTKKRKSNDGNYSLIIVRELGPQQDNSNNHIEMEEVHIEEGGRVIGVLYARRGNIWTTDIKPSEAVYLHTTIQVKGPVQAGTLLSIPEDGSGTAVPVVSYSNWSPEQKTGMFAIAAGYIEDEAEELIEADVRIDKNSSWHPWAPTWNKMNKAGKVVWSFGVTLVILSVCLAVYYELPLKMVSTGYSLGEKLVHEILKFEELYGLHTYTMNNVDVPIPMYSFLNDIHNLEHITRKTVEKDSRLELLLLSTYWNLGRPHYHTTINDTIYQTCVHVGYESYCGSWTHDMKEAKIQAAEQALEELQWWKFFIYALTMWKPQLHSLSYTKAAFDYLESQREMFPDAQVPETVLPKSQYHVVQVSWEYVNLYQCSHCDCDSASYFQKDRLSSPYKSANYTQVICQK